MAALPTAPRPCWSSRWSRGAFVHVWTWSVWTRSHFSGWTRPTDCALEGPGGRTCWTRSNRRLLQRPYSATEPRSVRKNARKTAQLPFSLGRFAFHPLSTSDVVVESAPGGGFHAHIPAGTGAILLLAPCMAVPRAVHIGCVPGIGPWRRFPCSHRMWTVKLEGPVAAPGAYGAVFAPVVQVPTGNGRRVLEAGPYK